MHFVVTTVRCKLSARFYSALGAALELASLAYRRCSAHVVEESNIVEYVL